MNKKFLLVIMAFAIIFTILPGRVFAAEIVEYSVTGGNIYFDKSTGTITDCDRYVTSAIIPEYIDGVQVTSIGSYAFRSCGSLTSIKIPDSVTSVGDYAFYWCESLTSIEIPNSVTSLGSVAFSHCENLASIEIPSGVTSIGTKEFEGCKELIRIVIPDSVASIGWQAFLGCERLSDVFYSGSENGWNEIKIGSNNNNLLSATIHYNSSIKIISDLITGGNICFDKSTGTIKHCDQSVTDAIIPETIDETQVTSIGERAFFSCGSLESIELPDSVTSIGVEAFHSCENLEDIEIPNSVVSIGHSAFAWCRSIESIKVPDGVTSLENWLFYGCESLTRIEISSGVTSIGGASFSYCKGLTRIDIPDSVTSIGAGAFANCEELSDVYYSGSEDEWNEIEIGSNNNKLLNASIHFNDFLIKKGDINGDGEVSNKDVTRLLRYIKYHDVEVVQEHLDTNGDGIVSNKDITRLIRYIKYKDVEIH